MGKLAIFALAGLLAQVVDGSLGMAYGVTSTSVLLAAGTAPAVASAVVHLAEVGTTAASGLSHWRFGNIDWRVVAGLGLPGAVGAFVGATALSTAATEVAAPWMSAVLIALGVYILVRFSRAALPVRHDQPPRRRFLAPLGLVAGFVDATGGGGWGPVANSALLSSGRLTPRTSIGSVNASELLVAVAASAGFLLGLGHTGLPFDLVAALLVGGVVIAPFAAWMVRRVPARVLGSGVGGLIVFTNVQTITDAIGVSDPVTYLVYAAVLAVWAAAVTASVRALRREPAQPPRESVPENV